MGVHFRQLAYAGVQSLLLGVASGLCVKASGVVTKTPLATIVGTIVGAALALHYAVGAYGEAKEMKRWKVQLLQAGVIGLAAVAATVACVASVKLALADTAILLAGSALAAGVQLLFAADVRRKKPLDTYRDALPRSLFDIPGKELYRKVEVLSPACRFDLFFNDYLGLSMRKAKLALIQSGTYTEEEIASLDPRSKGVQAVTNLGIFEFLRGLTVEGNDARALIIDPNMVKGNRRYLNFLSHDFQNDSYDPYKLKDDLCALVELARKLSATSVEPFMKKLTLVDQPEMGQSTPEEEQLYKGIMELKVKVLQIPKSDARQPYDWQHAFA